MLARVAPIARKTAASWEVAFGAFPFDSRPHVVRHSEFIFRLKFLKKIDGYI